VKHNVTLIHRQQVLTPAANQARRRRGVEAMLSLYRKSAQRATCPFGRLVHYSPFVLGPDNLSRHPEQAVTATFAEMQDLFLHFCCVLMPYRAA
jgi:hypothetical protein